jgi:uncharacterized protein
MWMVTRFGLGLMVALVGLGIFAGSAGAGTAIADYNRGVASIIEGNNKQAVEWFRKAAEQGLPDAQFSLGTMYKKRRGVAKNTKQTVMWYKKAAEQGHAEAQFNLGYMYYKGYGTTKDLVQAHKWSDLSATNGHVRGAAMKNLLAGKMTSKQIAEAQELAVNPTSQISACFWPKKAKNG